MKPMTAKPTAVAVVIFMNSERVLVSNEGSPARSLALSPWHSRAEHTFPVWLVAAAHEAHRLDEEAVQGLANASGSVHGGVVCLRVRDDG